MLGPIPAISLDQVEAAAKWQASTTEGRHLRVVRSAPRLRLSRRRRQHFHVVSLGFTGWSESQAESQPECQPDNRTGNRVGVVGRLGYRPIRWFWALLSIVCAIGSVAFVVVQIIRPELRCWPWILILGIFSIGTGRCLANGLADARWLLDMANLAIGPLQPSKIALDSTEL